jgi:endoglucanase
MTYDLMTMLDEITTAPGIPGFEEPAADVMRRYLGLFTEVSRDTLGSVIGRKRGTADSPRVMVAGHLDEIGMMVTQIRDDGFLKFQTLGGWWEQVMLAQRVHVVTKGGAVIGVIGSKPPHILNADERKKVVEMKAMFIDIGAESREQAESWGVRPGDPVVPVSPFTVMRNEKLVMAKAWDNRFGCAAGIEVARQLQEVAHPNTVHIVGTVQEEVGLRGARTTAHLVDPDVAFALDVGIAGDTPGISSEEAQGRVGRGPVILLYDRTMIPHLGLRNLVIATAQEEEIPHQFDAVPGGGTDAGQIHLLKGGVPALVVGVPTRYIHSHASIMHLDDFRNAVRLIVEVIKRLDKPTVARIRGT